MRLWVVFIILMLSSVFVSARTVNLDIGQSYYDDGHNITLVSATRDKAIVCVNNQKTIISEDGIRLLQDAYVEVIDINFNSVKLDIEVNCPNCECDESCNNNLCFNIIKPIQNVDQFDTISEIPEKELNSEQGVLETGVELIEPESVGFESFLLAGLLIVIIILGLILYWRRI